MELKRYQWAVMQDLARFLALLTEKQSAAGAYRTLWEEKGVKVGPDGLPPYRSSLKHAPELFIFLNSLCSQLFTRQLESLSIILKHVEREFNFRDMMSL